MGSIQVYITSAMRQTTGFHSPDIAEKIYNMYIKQLREERLEPICRGIKKLVEISTSNPDSSWQYNYKWDNLPATELVYLASNQVMDDEYERWGLVQQFKECNHTHYFERDYEMSIEREHYDVYLNMINKELKQSEMKLHKYSWHKDSLFGKLEDKWVGFGYYNLFMWEREIHKRWKADCDYNTFLDELYNGDYTFANAEAYEEFGLVNMLALMNMFDEYNPDYKKEGYEIWDDNDNLNDPILCHSTGDYITLGKVFKKYQKEAWEEYLENGGNDIENHKARCATYAGSITRKHGVEDVLPHYGDYYIHRSVFKW